MFHVNTFSVKYVMTKRYSDDGTEILGLYSQIGNLCGLSDCFPQTSVPVLQLGNVFKLPGNSVRLLRPIRTNVSMTAEHYYRKLGHAPSYLL
jgi:hypothetical protein